MSYVVVMFDRDGWHATWTGPTWTEALAAHAGTIGALRVLDHPQAETVKILSADSTDYTRPGLTSEPR